MRKDVVAMRKTLEVNLVTMTISVISLIIMMINMMTTINPLVFYTAMTVFFGTVIIAGYLVIALMVMNYIDRSNYKSFEDIMNTLQNLPLVLLLMAICLGMFYDAFEVKCGLTISMPIVAICTCLVCGYIIDTVYFKRFHIKARS